MGSLIIYPNLKYKNFVKSCWSYIDDDVKEQSTMTEMKKLR